MFQWQCRWNIAAKTVQKTGIQLMVCFHKNISAGEIALIEERMCDQR